MAWYGLDLSGSGWGPVEGFCEHGNEPSGPIIIEKLLVAERLAASQEDSAL
jgi:hypothetical protein